MGVLEGCVPRDEVLRTDLDDTIFAADFGDLIAGIAPKVYSDPETFFQNTHPARELCRVVQAVFARLADPKDAGATIRLSTGFGGGKTHTLMALWHLANHIDDPALGTDVLPAAGRPRKVKVFAIDAAKAGVPNFATHGSARVKSLAGELVYLMGSKTAWQALGESDHPEASLNDTELRAVFPDGPVLILLDELVIYMAKLSERGQKNLLGFLNLLTAVVSRRPQTVLVVTDPGTQAVYAQQSAQLGGALSAAAADLDDILGRRVSDKDPIGEEAARIIVRRLFESVSVADAQAASASYHALYQRVAQEHPGLLPTDLSNAAYAKRIVACYPFHPRLLDTAQDRLGAMQSFQKSRGVLRLFARILRNVWDSDLELDLITAGEIDWASPRIQEDLLNRLDRNSFKAAVSSDVQHHAGELDGGAERGIHRRVASALLLESLPLQPNSGLDQAELSAAVLRPDEAGLEPGEALDRLVGVCWHTYPLAGGRGWQFHYEPNIIKQIDERRATVSLEDARGRVYSEAQGYFMGPTFKLASWPATARQVPRTADLQLALCENETIAHTVCDYEDDSDPQSPIPRLFKNSIVAVTASAASLAEAIDRAQRLIAAEEIERENKTGDAGKLVRDQLAKVKPDMQKRFSQQARRAFDRVVTAGHIFTLDEKYQVPEEQITQRAQGQQCLKNFLEAKHLIYGAGDALDTNRFLTNVLPGATPQVSTPEVYTARAVHERFLGAPDLRLLPDGAVVRQSLLKALKEGKIVVHTSDGRAYDTAGYVAERPDGRRQRGVGAPTTFSLDDSVLITRTDSPAAKDWLRVDPAGGGSTGGGKPKPPPPPPGRLKITTWDKLADAATNRPLSALHVRAATPAAAATLLSLAQPLGADKVSLAVSVGGAVKDGGSMNFAADGVKPNHPTRPLLAAQTIFNALADGATYEAELALAFEPPRLGLSDALATMAGAAGDALQVEAEFEPPVGA